MKILYTFTLLLFSIWGYTQNHTIYYSVKFKTDSTKNKYQEDITVLDISPKYVKFYAKEYLKTDSINKTIKNNEKIFAYPEFTNIIKRPINTGKNTEYFSMSPDYYSLASTDVQNWKILNETKTLPNNIRLQKATTRFGKRNWTAWFATEYPISEGPYKFRGLPGLIFELKDDKDNFLFSLLQIINDKTTRDTQNFVETMNGTQPIPINHKKFIQLNIDYFHNPLKGFNSGLIVVDKNGQPVKINEREATLKYQKHLRKNNNPIDLNNIIHYPE